MKILYVEDELTKNIPRINRLFDKYLSDDQKTQLDELEHDTDGYDRTPEAIKQIVESCGMIDVEYRFPDALHKVLESFDSYSLFIIDRNLTYYDFSLEDVINYEPQFDDNLLKKYEEREGDYLLHVLAHKGIDIKSQFYFFTAYSHAEIPNKDEIQNYIDLKVFKKENIIEKGNTDSEKELVRKIENLDVFILQWKNQKYINVLRSKVKNNSVYNFISLLQNRSSSDAAIITSNLGLLRNLLENILTIVANKNNAPERCFNKSNTKQIVMGDVIYWITEKENGSPFYSNSIIKNSLYDIKQICSDFGSHNQSNVNFKPTTDTVNSLIYALKDIILWFDSL